MTDNPLDILYDLLESNAQFRLVPHTPKTPEQLRNYWTQEDVAEIFVEGGQAVESSNAYKIYDALNSVIPLGFMIDKETGIPLRMPTPDELSAYEQERDRQLEEARKENESKERRDRIDELKRSLEVRETAFKEYRAERNPPPKWADTAAIVKKLLEEGIHSPKADIGTFSDESGRALFYRNRYNTIWGPEGTGKSLIVAKIQVEFINEGNHVIHLEYDNNTDEQVHARLLEVGADPEKLGEFFHFCEPADNLPEIDAAWVAGGLLVIDSLNPFLSTYGIDTNNSGRAIDTFMLEVVQPFVQPGGTVITIDHSGNEHPDRPTNNRRKLQAVQGAALQVVNVVAGHRGTRWASKFIVRKDNPGGLAVARNEEIGYAVFDDSFPGGTVVITFEEAPMDILAAAENARQEAHRDQLEDDADIAVRIVATNQPILSTDLRKAIHREVKDFTRISPAISRAENDGRIHWKKLPGRRGNWWHVGPSPHHDPLDEPDGT